MIKQTYKSKTKANKTSKQAPTQVEPGIETLVEAVITAGTALAAKAAPVNGSAPGGPVQAVIKLGIDAHADRHGGVRQIDGGAPQPPQRFSPSQFLEWAKKQTGLAKRVYSCYEAGPFGYSVHRKLAA